MGLGTTTPVGIFPDGASPYGVLDMSGNVGDWTRSLYRAYDVKKFNRESDLEWISDPFVYPYELHDGREDLDKGDEWMRVVRGGSWYFDNTWLRCAARGRGDPYARSYHLGFRVVVSPFSPLNSDASGL